MIGEIIFTSLAVLFTVIIVLPWVRSDHWTFRVLEYPRLQKLFLGLAILTGVASYGYYMDQRVTWQVILLVLCNGYLLYKIIPYTFLAKKEMKRVPSAPDGKELKLFTANVFQDNRAYHRMLEQIRACDPDVIFLVETDKAWQDGVKELEKDYPHRLSAPLDNTYGLLFFSRFPFSDGRVQYLVDKEIPSVEAYLHLDDNLRVRLFGLHPKPPVPQESSYATAKDKELMKVALEIEGNNEPCIVMGDLNDVAWSYVTSLFRKVSGLIDPRIGRGFFSTFSANHWWMRFPLDYIFCSTHFGLVHMKRMPHNGSDHFAMFIRLQYMPALTGEQDAPEPDAQDHEVAKEKATAAVPPENG